MGGRQKKKQAGGKKKKKSKPVAQKMQPEHPDIEESEELGDGGDGFGAAGATAGFDLGSFEEGSFEEALYDLKAEAQSVGVDARVAAQAAATATEEEWMTADTAYEDLQRACEAHAELWAKVDKLTPVRWGSTLPFRVPTCQSVLC